MSNLEALHMRAKALNLHGLLAHWEEAAAAGVEGGVVFKDGDSGFDGIERSSGAG